LRYVSGKTNKQRNKQTDKHADQCRKGTYTYTHKHIIHIQNHTGQKLHPPRISVVSKWLGNGVVEMSEDVVSDSGTDDDSDRKTQHDEDMY